MTASVVVIDTAEQAQVLLQPARLQIMEQLSKPASAASLARDLGLPRQRLNYHLRELEEHRLVELVEERHRGSISERVYRRVGDRFAVSVAALGDLGSTPVAVQDRFSSAYQIALASRVIADVANLREGAAASGKRLPTLSLELDVRFASAEARSAFAQELAETMAALAKKYHDQRASGGRAFCVYLGAYPKPKA